MGIYCCKIKCPNIDMLTGKCKITACSKTTIQTQVVSHVDEMIFPQIIGDIKFNTSKELIKWVENQQKMNKDPEYGRGNWA